ncbi:hypothetical protein CH305_20970 [Rhodococcus sp. 15-649-2-2]|uniref:aminotransferase class III-fold pyridoxal phosphate-dependent enzyme n=1 Tax=Rhodococcus sp. 15-649-2-2 TaxID=2023140 RepID=UPI000B9B06C6|nr:aminotransferase class III-fold pyridoxal phosphate-dependent enzyme [Rhodococcus sp. 15-649-2-2]OZE74181.1 hypothetical protein CH305_20970 [Rhodococcus sp. 15-649-2-2]
MLSDAVQSGWGRTGRSYFGIEHYGVRPQAMTFAKGLANGLAIGGVVAEERLMNSIQANSISTAGGNPVAMAAGNAVIDFIDSHELQENADRIGQHLLSSLAAISRSNSLMGEVRGSGLMIGVELIEPGSKTPNRVATDAVLAEAKAAGLLLGKGGLHGNVLRITPPMTVTLDEANEALQTLESVLSKVAAQTMTS